MTRSPALNLFILAPPGRARISSDPRRLNWKTDFTLVSQGKRCGPSSYLIVFLSRGFVLGVVLSGLRPQPGKRLEQGSQ